MLGNGNTVVVELAEALAGVVPVDGPHFLFAADGAAAVEQALKIAFQYWVNRGERGPHPVPGAGRRLPRRHRRGRCRWATAASAPPCSTRCASRCCAPPATPTRAGRPRPAPRWQPTPASWRRWSSSRWCRGPRGCCAPSRPTWPRSADACRGSRGRCSSATRWPPASAARARLFASEQCGHAARPAVPGQGDHRRLPAHVGHRGLGPGLRRLPGRGPRPAHVLPRPLLRRQRPGRRGGPRAPPAADPTESCPGQRGRRGRPAGDAAGRDGRPPHRGVARGPPARPHGRHRAGAARAAGLRWGRRVCAGAVRRGVLLRPLGDVVVLMPPAHHHRGRDRPDRRRAGRSARRGGRGRHDRRRRDRPGIDAATGRDPDARADRRGSWTEPDGGAAPRDLRRPRAPRGPTLECGDRPGRGLVRLQRLPRA